MDGLIRKCCYALKGSLQGPKLRHGVVPQVKCDIGIIGQDGEHAAEKTGPVKVVIVQSVCIYRAGLFPEVYNP